MGRTKKRTAAGRLNYLKRAEKRVKFNDSYTGNDESIFNFQDMNESLEEIKINLTDKSIETDLKEDKQTQTCWPDDTDNIQNNDTEKGAYKTDIKKKLDFHNICDLICILFNSIENFNFIHRRILSVLIYLLLRLVSINFEECNDILRTPIEPYRRSLVFFEKICSYS